MNIKKIAGIDYSLTSPAICVYKEEEDGGYFDFDGCVFHYLFNSERQRQLAARSGLSNLKAEPYPEWKTAEERHEKLTAWAYRIVQGCDEVYLEGYAYMATGRNIHSITENTGLLKHKMWKNKVSFKSYPPTVIKKFATGKGNANKELMYEAFIGELLTPTDLKERLTPKAKKVINPISDIVDSYFIAKCGVEGML